MFYTVDTTLSLPVMDGMLFFLRRGDSYRFRVARGCRYVTSAFRLSGEALGKPRDRADAIRMLQDLSGKRHSVHTGIAVYYEGKHISDTASTAVYFKELSMDEIEAYVDSGEPMDKAGAYAIQGGAGRFVEKTEGDFDTVVGLSLRLLTELIERACKS